MVTMHTKEGTALYRKLKGMLVIVAIAGLAACGGKSKEELYAEGVKELNAGNANGAIVLLKNALDKDQNYFDARYQLAKAYLASGKYEQAEKELQKGLRQAPSRPEIRLDLAKLYNSINKPDMAITEAQEYLKVKPGSADALEALGIAHARKQSLAEAEKFFRQALQAEPGRVSTKIELARLCLAVDREAEGRALLEEIFKTDPRNTTAYYLAANFEMSRGNRAKAMEYFQRIVEVDPSDANAMFRVGLMYIDANEIDKADRLADEILKKGPNLPDGHRLKGIVHYAKKNYDAAVAELQNSLKIAQNPGSYYYLGLSHYNRNELEQALSQFRKVLDLNPSNLQARLMSAMILLQQKRVDDAITEVNRVIDADDKYPLAHNILGSAYIAKGDADAALKELNRALELDPKLVDAHLKKGIVNLARGKKSEGESELETAVRVAPEVLNTRYLLASYYMRQKNYGRAQSVLRDGLKGDKRDALLYNMMAVASFADKREKDGLTFLQKAKASDPTYPAPYINLAGYYVSKGQPDQAINEYNAVLKIDGSNLTALLGLGVLHEGKGKTSEALGYYTKARDTKKPAGYTALASFYLRQKDSAKALAVLDEAIKTLPGDAPILEMKGAILAGQQKYAEAVKVYESLERVAPARALPLKIRAYVAMKDIPKAVEQAQKIISATPRSAGGHLILASIYESQRDFDRALAAIRSGMAAEPDSLQAAMALGSLYEKKRDFNQAIATYDSILKKNPKSVPALFAKGAAYDLSGRKQEAVGVYREVLKRSPNYVPALNNLAFLYAEGYGSKAEALALATRAADGQQNNPGVMDTYGYVLLKNGKRAEALKILAQAASQMPTNPTVQYHLAVAYRENGNRAQAAATVRQALKLGDFPEAGAARALLAELK